MVRPLQRSRDHERQKRIKNSIRFVTNIPKYLSGVQDTDLSTPEIVGDRTILDFSFTNFQVCRSVIEMCSCPNLEG